MCRNDLTDILQKVKHELLQECQESDKLRTELIESGRNLSECKLSSEKKVNQVREDAFNNF